MHLTLTNDSRIDKDTLRVAVNRGDAGETSTKQGRPPIIPSKFTNTLSKQEILMQVAGQVEKESKATVNTANALIFGTKWTGKINTDNAWSKACTNYPEILQPRKLKDSEDGQVNWLP